MAKKSNDQPKRFMVMNGNQTRVPVSGLKIGMYLEQLDRPWEETPFLFQGFVIQTQEEIDTLKDICDYAYIDLKRSIEINNNPKNNASTFVKHKTIPSALAEGIDYRPQESKPKPKSKRKPYPHPTTAANVEYTTALTCYNEGLALCTEIMTRVAAEKPIYMQQIKTVVSNCIQSILRNPDALLWLTKIRNESQYTSEHCFNVCVFSLIFGRHLGIQGNELLNLGICAVLCDVGKMNMPKDILNKPDKLNKIETLIMRTHAELGRDTLTGQDDMLPDAIEVAYSHHETYDGKGYPRGLAGEEIHEFSRIIAICDTYDAITSDRVYKKSLSSLEALRYLYQHRDSTFDPILVVQFIECMGLYPLGNIVELNSGEVAIVIATNFVRRRLPKILIILNKNKKPCRELIVDLAAEPKNYLGEAYAIRTTIPNGSYGIQLEKYAKRGLTMD